MLKFGISILFSNRDTGILVFFTTILLDKHHLLKWFRNSLVEKGIDNIMVQLDIEEHLTAIDGIKPRP